MKVNIDNYNLDITREEMKVIHKVFYGVQCAKLLNEKWFTDVITNDEKETEIFNRLNNQFDNIHFDSISLCYKASKDKD